MRWRVSFGNMVCSLEQCRVLLEKLRRCYTVFTHSKRVQVEMIRQREPAAAQRQLRDHLEVLESKKTSKNFVYSPSYHSLVKLSLLLLSFYLYNLGFTKLQKTKIRDFLRTHVGFLGPFGNKVNSRIPRVVWQKCRV